jgi:septal ring factor EnvC (AmiA/AmiB activator)
MLGRLASLVALPLALVASASGQPLSQARAELAAAEAEAARLEQLEARARGAAERAAAQRRAAAARVIAAEAAISAAAAEFAARERLAQSAEMRLARRRQPVAALVAGVAELGRRPPLLTVADGTSAAELVRIRALLDTAIPHIRARSAALSVELAERRRLADEARRSGARLAEARRNLQGEQRRLAALERSATALASRSAMAALEAGDFVVRAGDRATDAAEQRRQARQAAALAAAVAGLGPAPPRPFAAGPVPAGMSFNYRLPIAAPLIEGMGAIDENGIRARGLRLKARRGAAAVAPADSVIAFAGPYRRHDSVLILDHGNGWMTVVTGIRSTRLRGTRVRAGEALGIALGEVTVELSQGGRHVSPALAAARSLSIQAKRG